MSNTDNKSNVDAKEIARFEEMARKWWDKESEFKPLHDINPLRLSYITERVNLSAKRVLDVGCGGGILSESMAELGAQVTGIDMGEAALTVARLHQHEPNLNIDYQQATIEEIADSDIELFDVITCLEMLEHVPDPCSVIGACRQLLKPDGQLFLSTINRNPKSYLFMVIGAEYVLNLLPRGTHDYAKFLKPSEISAWLRQHNLNLRDITGMTYNPLTGIYRLSDDVDVNYLVHATN
ncbi:MAG: bifunctional 2-polyprenyl-6-hydroxyphenol methylase/3-demethylubiquinol 3-O-methyltransferase UbiG [Gammaproteobacteria bacterium]|nr:bifunctional 2-polyprenyl-6-hydroxyphenol methylase/3-demethylubiquinol 3-O-methyltransferase UbiG [Gammaproteobacteria bacterium]